MNDFAVRVTGLREFNTKIKRLDAKLPKTMRLALNEVSEVVIKGAKPRVPKDTGKAVGSIKARSTQSLVRVAAGGSKAPYYPWLDFGGRVGKNNSVSRPFLKRGRYLYRSYHENRDEFVEVLSSRLRQQARLAGLAVT
jgi:hypothetical protein